MMTLRPQPLSAQAFSRFGTVIEHARALPLQPIEGTFESSLGAMVPSLALLRVETAFALPLTIDRLERHPHSTQTFLPILGGRCLILVCDAGEDGEPLPHSAMAFIATGRQGITYRRNVWHRSVTALEAPSEFAVVMAKTGNNDDNVFCDLSVPIEVSAFSRCLTSTVPSLSM